MEISKRVFQYLRKQKIKIKHENLFRNSIAMYCFGNYLIFSK